MIVKDYLLDFLTGDMMAGVKDNEMGYDLADVTVAKKG